MSNTGTIAQSTPPIAPRQTHTRLLLMAALAVVAVTYSEVIHGGFVWDDLSLISEQEVVTELQPLPEYFSRVFWADPNAGDSRAFYRPITTLSYALEYATWGPSPGLFHLTNLLLHLVVCALLFHVCRRAGAPPLAAALATALFGTFPRLTESVAWISGRTDILASLGALSALLLHRSEPEAGRRRWLAAGMLFIGLCGKEVAVAGLAAIWAQEWVLHWRSRRSRRTTLANLAPATTSFTFFVLLHQWTILTHESPLPESPPLFALFERVVIPFQALGTYATMLADPLRPRIQIGVLGVIEWRMVMVGVLAAALLAGLAALMIRRRWPPFWIGVAAFSATGLGLVLQVLPLAVNVVACDRFLYVPLIGVCALLATASAKLPPRSMRVAGGVCALLLVAFMLSARAQSRLWGDEMRFWRTAAATTEGLNSLPFLHLGNTLRVRGDLEGALASYATAIERNEGFHDLYPDHPWGALSLVYGNIAICLADLGRDDEALAILEELVANYPQYPLNHFNLALARARVFDFEGARRALDRTLALHPGFEDARIQRNRLEQAEIAWRALPAPRPGEPAEVSAARARLHATVGHRREAGRHWRAVAAAPDATPDLVRQAATFLVAWGNVGDAREALARLQDLPGMRDATLQLTQALSAREDETHPAG